MGSFALYNCTMSEFSDLVYRLNQKMEYVLQHASSVKEELNEKEAEIASLKQELQNKERELALMRERVELVESAQALTGGNENGRREARLKINELVREIDKCIALLNK